MKLKSRVTISIFALVFVASVFIFLIPWGSVVAQGEGGQRIFGSDRFLTAVEVSKTGWQQAETVVLARADEYADALAGAPLAYKYNAPILLTLKDSLNKSARDEITRLKATRVIILGGSQAVSDSYV
ncbi:MAG: cell wall-binding repeat-containing protein [Clostridiales bacterium]|jgi:putative cell wall-binding protein|nr:cell wall-binding repeat-containing protein [Clostridiales bacterium]